MIVSTWRRVPAWATVLLVATLSLTGAVVARRAEAAVPNSPPQAVDDFVSTPSDIAVSIDVLANDTDPDGDPLTIDATPYPLGTTNGIVDLDVTMGRLVYTPNNGFVGPETFTYGVTDGMATSTATVTVDVGFHSNILVGFTFGSPGTQLGKSAVLGAPTTYGMYALNASSFPAHDVTITNSVPSNFVITGVSDPDCTVTGNDITCIWPVVDPYDLTINNSVGTTVYLDPVATGLFTNSMTVTSLEDDPAVPPPTADYTSSVYQSDGTADLGALGYWAPATSSVGDQFWMSFNGQNYGPSVATNAVLTDTIPSNFRIDSISNPTDCSVAGNTVTCQRATLSGYFETFVFLTAVLPGSWTNSATITSNTPEAAPEFAANTWSTSGTVAGLVFTSADHAGFTAAAPGTFTVTVAGQGPLVLSSVGVLPPGVAFVDNGDGTATLAGTPDIASAGSHPLTITAANGVDPNATQTFTLTVDPPPVPVPTIISGPANPTSNLDATFTFTSAVPGLTFECSTDSGVSWSACASPTTATLTYGPQVFHVRAVDSTGARSTAASYSWTIVPLFIEVTNDSVHSIVEPGGPVTHTVTITNRSLVSVTLDSVTDNVYGNLAGPGQCAVGTVIAPLSTYTCTFVGNVSGVEFQSYVDVVTVAVSDAYGHTVTRSASTSVQIMHSPVDLTVTFFVSSSVVSYGDPVDVFVRIRNNNLVRAFSIQTIHDGITGATYPCAVDLAPGGGFTQCGHNGVPAGFGGMALPGDVVAGSATVSGFDPSGLGHTEVSNTVTVTIRKLFTQFSMGPFSNVASTVFQPWSAQLSVVPALISVPLPPGLTPSGVVTVTDDAGATVCSAPASLNACIMVPLQAGPWRLHFDYSGDLRFAAASVALTHQVDPSPVSLAVALAPLVTTVVGQPLFVPFTYDAPRPDLATGVVTVSDGVDSCSAPPTATGCTITPLRAGTRAVVASYPGDTNFLGTTSAGVSHRVDPAATNLAITGVAPPITLVNQSYAVSWSLSVLAPGGGTPTGTVVVGDGTDSCSAAVAAGSCALTSSTVGSKVVTVRYVPATGDYVTSAAATVHSVVLIFVSSVTPSTRAVGLTNQIFDIRGGGFVSGARVTVTGVPNANQTTAFVDSTHLTLTISTIPAGAVIGPHDVTVANPGAGGLSATCAGCLVFDPRPTLTSAAPAALPQGATANVVLTGTGFISGATVSFGSGVTVNAPPSVGAGGTSLTVNVTIATNAGVGAYTVTVTNTDGGSVSKAMFKVNAAPVIFSITPNALAQGVAKDVVINGASFATPSPAVSFGPGVTVRAVIRNSANKLTVSVTVDPSAAIGARDVTVTNPDSGTATKLAALTIDALPSIAPPLAPNAIAIGLTNKPVIVHGAGFRLGATVAIAGARVVSTTVNSATQLTLSVSAPTATAIVGSHDVVVTNLDGGAATCVACFSVNPLPTVTSVSPSSATRGTSGGAVTITGTGFQQNIMLALSGGGVTLSNFVVVDPTMITCTITVQSNAATGNRTLTATNSDGGVATKAAAIRIL